MSVLNLKQGLVVLREPVILAELMVRIFSRLRCIVIVGNMAIGEPIERGTSSICEAVVVRSVKRQLLDFGLWLPHSSILYRQLNHNDIRWDPSINLFIETSIWTVEFGQPKEESCLTFVSYLCRSPSISRCSAFRCGSGLAAWDFLRRSQFIILDTFSATSFENTADEKGHLQTIETDSTNQ